MLCLTLFCLPGNFRPTEDSVNNLFSAWPHYLLRKFLLTTKYNNDVAGFYDNYSAIRNYFSASTFETHQHHI